MFRINPNHQFNSPSRQEIHDATKDKKSDYAQQVHGVNQILDKNHFSISDRSKASVLDNVAKVETGDRSEINAHQREALNFGRDAFESVRKGDYRQAGITAFGSGLNALGSMFKSTYTETPLEKRGVTPH